MNRYHHCVTILSNSSCIRRCIVSLSIQQPLLKPSERKWQRRSLHRNHTNAATQSTSQSRRRSSRSDDSQEDAENSSYFVVVPGTTILPSNSLLQSLQIPPPPPSTITFRQPQQPTSPFIIIDPASTATTSETDTDPTNTTDKNVAPSVTPKESITINMETEELPVILFQSNRLLMIDKPAGWKVPMPIKPKTLDEITKPRELPGVKQLKRLREVPYFDTDVPWDEHPDNPDNPVPIERKSHVRMLMSKVPQDPIVLMNNIIKNIENQALLNDNKESYELQLIQQHLKKKEIRMKEQQLKEKIQRTQYTKQLASETYAHKQNLQKSLVPSNHLERVRDILNTTSIDATNTNNNSTSNTTDTNKLTRTTTEVYPPSPDLISYLSNVKYKVYRHDRIRYTNIVPAHGIDPTTSGLVLLGTGPKSKNRFRTIYKDGYKLYYAILQPISDDKLRRDVSLRTRLEYNEEYPFVWKLLDGYMLEQAPCTDEIYLPNRVPTQIYYKQHDIDRLKKNIMTKNLWYCSLEYRVVLQPRYSNDNQNQNPYICLEIKSKQVGHEVIRALLSTYQLYIFGDMKYGANDPHRYMESNKHHSYDSSDSDELEPIFPLNNNNSDNANQHNTSYYRTSRHNGDDTIDLGLYGRVPLHCTSIQCRKHIHLGPQESLNPLHRTVISAPIPALWENYFDWTWDDIQIWEQACIDYGIQAA